MRLRYLLIGWVVVVALLGAACGSDAQTVVSEGSSTSSTAPLVTVDVSSFAPGTLESWRANTGLEVKPDDVWAERITTACSEGVWKPDVAERLARQYAAEDGATQEQLADRHYLEGAADGLWLVAVAGCHDSFPPDDLKRGPNFHFTS